MVKSTIMDIKRMLVIINVLIRPVLVSVLVDILFDNLSVHGSSCKDIFILLVLPGLYQKSCLPKLRHIHWNCYDLRLQLQCTEFTCQGRYTYLPSPVKARILHPD